MSDSLKLIVAEAQDALEGSSPVEILRWAASRFAGKASFATSLGVEDQALTAMIAGSSLDIPIFTLDTGRRFPETYDLINATQDRFGVDITVYSPDTDQLEAMVNRHGVNLFRDSVELRRECCRVRKIEPLRRALAGLDAWICGLRREQAPTRTDLKAVEWDEGNGLVKICPLIDWTEEDAWSYVREHGVPYNALHDSGFPSIGCACCTRAIEPGEDVRAGRWWWESPDKKECGLHSRTAAAAAASPDEKAS